MSPNHDRDSVVHIHTRDRPMRVVFPMPVPTRSPSPSTHSPMPIDWHPRASATTHRANPTGSTSPTDYPHPTRANSCRWPNTLDSTTRVPPPMPSPNPAPRHPSGSATTTAPCGMTHARPMTRSARGYLARDYRNTRKLAGVVTNDVQVVMAAERRPPRSHFAAVAAPIGLSGKELSRRTPTIEPVTSWASTSKKQIHETANQWGDDSSAWAIDASQPRSITTADPGVPILAYWSKVMRPAFHATNA